MSIFKPNNMKQSIFIFALMFMCATENTVAQERETTDFIDEIKNQDLAKLWSADKYIGVWLEGEESRECPEPIGFIGDNYQRFYMHIISAIKVKDKPDTYYLYGKTRTKDNVCIFQGTATIVDAKLFKEKIIQDYQQGYANCNIVLYENDKQSGSGKITGTIKSYFVIDKKGVFVYDGLEFVADGFCNNQFIGTWRSYKTGKSKKCHWGDYRIPNCGDLDIGAGEFSVNDKYVKNGWENYMKSWLEQPDTEEGKKARQEEARQWWKD